MDDSTNIKEAFAKVKTDIFTLGNQFYSLKNELADIKNSISALNESINSMKIELMDLKADKFSRNYPTHIPTDNLKKTTIPAIPTHIPTPAVETQGLKYPNIDISSGNGGVPTDRQTNQQTDEYPHFYKEKPLVNQISDAQDILASLDAVKKEIRLKFKQITSQEMLVFSTIYQLESEFPEGIEYKQIAQKLRLSESSIRDYTQKLINKGIPVDKIKLNNKKILLKISQKLKNIAQLDTLIKLREL